MNSLFLVIALLLVSFETCRCFTVQNMGHVGIHTTTCNPAFSKSNVMENSLKHRNSALCVKKKSKEIEEAANSGAKKKLDPLELIVLFMTPWRNPNSIFVYMFLVLYVLGKMNETPH
jgi:hypothetical protein